MEQRLKIGLGTVQFGLKYGISNTTGQTAAGEVTKILNYATSEGISILDTAFGYGESEAVLGQNGLQHFKIVSKFLPPGDSLSIEEQFTESCTRLGVKQLYGYLAHRPTAVFENPVQWEVLKKLKAKGKVSKIGFSFNTPDEVDRAIESGMIPDLIQVPYNYLDRRFEEKIKALKEQYACEIHTRSVFMQGLFFTPTACLPCFFDPIKELLNDFKKHYPNTAGSLLQFALVKPFIDCVVIGVNEVNQLQENIASLKHAVVPIGTDLPTIPEVIIQPSNWPKL